MHVGVCENGADVHRVPRSAYPAALKLIPIQRRSMASKDELAAMAESLVNLTSFKRRITAEAETVGGPIDVAVISKGDGFVWIRRKHYFDRNLNPGFFANYYRRNDDD